MSFLAGTHTESVALTRLFCGECGMTFAAPDDWVRQRRDNGEHGRQFYCPNGHCRVWQKSELDRVRERNAQLTADLDQKRAELAARTEALIKTGAERDRLRKRVAGGVCPCCNRTFKQLAAHMKHKHPEYPREAKG